MSLAKQYQQEIINNIKHLPKEKLIELVDFSHFLKEHYGINTNNSNKKIVKLGGLWKGIEINENEIKKTRKRIWEKLEDKVIL